MDEIIFGAGCFWGVQDLFENIPGVIKTEVGYAGGDTLNPTYSEVCTGKTNHAEVVKITFDSSKISLNDLLDVFWYCHNPASLNRQGPDIGSQYRSCIFYSQDEQLPIIEHSKKELETDHENLTVVTQIEKLSNYTKAEEYHQYYHQKNK